MKLGVIIEWVDQLLTFRRQVRLADELGYDVIGVGDTPARAFDVYVSLAVAAQESRRATLASLVTTPFVRHPAATATAMSTLYEVAGGRVVLGIGAGGSAPRVIGHPTGATQPELREYFTAVREIIGGGAACVAGRMTERIERVRPMPLYLAADHPKSLRLAGELADGVVTTVGRSLPLVARKIETVRAAAREAGRDADAIEFWGFSFVCVAGSRAEANAEIGTALASDVGLRLKGPHLRAIIPSHLRGAVREMERRYDLHDHVVGGKNAKLLAELGLVDFAAELTAVTGTVAEVAEHLKKLESIGVSAVFAALPALADPDRTLHGFRRAGELVGAGRPAMSG